MAWLKDIAAQHHGVLKLRRDGEYSQHIPILELALESRSIQGEVIDPSPSVILDFFEENAIDFGQVGEPAGVAECGGDRSFPLQFVYSRLVDTPYDRNLRTGGWNIDHISRE